MLARELTGANQVEAVAYGTEAGHFQNYGIPAVICGPGSIEQAHRPDEFCALSELEACEDVPAQSDRESLRLVTPHLAC